MQRRVTCIALFFCLVSSSSAEKRIWTNAAGDQHVTAEFLTAKYGKVWLLRNDGHVFGVDATELSKPDQDLVRRLVRERAARQKEVTQNLPGRVPYGPGRELCRLQNQEIDESSGLAGSQQHPGFFWTHNDSTNAAQVFLLDSAGRDLGACRLKNVFNYDFEDMFSFQTDGKNYLVLCDVGNNGRAAPVQMLHVIEEPPFDPETGLAQKEVPVLQTIYYSYEDDHRDCEAVGIDPTSRTILMVTKERSSPCYVYALPWPESRANKAFVARKIATLTIPTVTAMDVSPDGRRVVVLTYGNAYEYVRGQQNDWAHAFAGMSRKIIVPERVQGESICYGSDGKTLYLTSEQLPTPLLTVPVIP